VAELSVPEWAESQGISRQAAWKRVKSGKVALNANGKIDVDAAAKQWESNKDARQQRAKPKPQVPRGRLEPKAEEDPHSLAAAQKAREWLKVAKEDLLLKKMRGELLAADEVESEWAALISAARSRLLLLPDKVAQRVGGPDVHQLRAVIDEEIREALSALSESSDE